MSKFIAEFKEFAVRGNMLDMAIGMIVGGAFTALVNSIVTNIATPLIGIFFGIDLKNIEIVLPRLWGNISEPNILTLGVFLDSLISFIIIALVVFLFVKGINRFRKKQEDSVPEAPPTPTQEELLLAEIRDILKEMKIER
ncbi:MAG: large conductance mechanosensitive channel protein MscL [Oscillospiraceae bacterium]|nr:large conductance mechanosensitive channel protein MscL [Oscillospiraceae bacterium]